MCYAIPGNVKSIAGNLITVDYFGEERKAQNDFYNLQVGNYVYKQGQFSIPDGRSLSEVIEGWPPWDFFQVSASHF